MILRKRKITGPAKEASRPSLDFMAIGAHADDIEIHAGGTVAGLTALGRKGILVDISDASMGTRGTPAIRRREAEAAAKTLGLDRVNLGLPDGLLTNDLKAQTALIACLRRFRPRILITHGPSEDHPDHAAVYQLVRAASFRSGLARFKAEDAAWRPQRIFHWIGMEPPAPSFAVDITAAWPRKIAAISCYASQFFHAGAGAYAGKTDIASPEFMQALEYRARYFGARIKRKYAEAFVCDELPEITDLTSLGGARFP